MAFEKELPQWKEKGVKPPQSKLDEGWKVQDKPPAAWLNWQMNKTYEALKEVQEKAAEKTEVVSAIEDTKKYTDQKVAGIDLTKITPDSIGAVKKSDFDAHTADGTRHVTASDRNTWNTKETTDGAQAKANTAETNAKNYVNGLQWQRRKVSDDAGNAIVVSDLNADLTTGWYMGSNMANAPTSEWFWVEIIRHNHLWTVQNAYCFNRQSYYQRMKINGNWTPWSQDLFQSGNSAKQGTVDAIISKGISASMTDEWPTLHNKIRTLHGKHETVLKSSGSSNQTMDWQYFPLGTVPAGATQVLWFNTSDGWNAGTYIHLLDISTWGIEVKLQLIDKNGKIATIDKMSASPYAITRVVLQSFAYSPTDGNLYYNRSSYSNGSVNGYGSGVKNVGTLDNSGELQVRLDVSSPDRSVQFNFDLKQITYT
jgi:hypothetical protein